MTNDVPRVAERVRERLVTSAPLVWAQAHRVALAGLVAAVVAATGGTAFAVTRPPAVDPVVDVSIIGWFSGTRDTGEFSDRSFDSQGRFTVTPQEYVVSTEVLGDLDTPLGIVGPGLTGLSSSFAGVDVDHRRTGALGATLDCTDGRLWDAKDTDFRVRVSRTDSYGRVTTYDAPFDEAQPGAPLGAYWQGLVRDACTSILFRTLPPAVATSMTAVRGRHELDATLVFINPTGRDLRFVPLDSHSLAHANPSGLVPSASGVLVNVEEKASYVTLPAGAASTAVWHLAGLHCPRSFAQLPLWVWLPTERADTSSSQILLALPSRVPIDSGSQARLDSTVAGLCTPKG